MGEQQSQKRGVRSESQKEAGARDAYAPIPPSSQVPGAFGDHKSNTPSDEEVSLTLEEKARKKRNE
jgi:hypothetical protein